jgi:hypothetical protein
MAVATRRLADGGFRPDGTLIYLAVADEEAMGAFGAEHLATNEAEAVRADYVITESGGFPFPTAGGTRLPVIVAEKGPYWTRLVIKGTPGHGSMPHGTDNALIKAAEVVRRLAEYTPEVRITETWQQFVEGLGLPAEVSGPLLSAEGFDDAVAAFPPGLQRLAHACTRTTIAPTMLRGGCSLGSPSTTRGRCCAPPSAILPAPSRSKRSRRTRRRTHRRTRPCGTRSSRFHASSMPTPPSSRC